MSGINFSAHSIRSVETVMHVSEYDPYSPTIRKKDSFTNRLLLVRMHKHYWYYRITYPGKILLFGFFLSGIGTISEKWKKYRSK